MRSFATTDHAAPSAAPAPLVARLQADLAALRAGAHAFARMLSMIMTWERQGQDFFATAHQALTDACSQN
jgi:hypothetical protein